MDAYNAVKKEEIKDGAREGRRFGKRLAAWTEVSRSPEVSVGSTISSQKHGSCKRPDRRWHPSLAGEGTLQDAKAGHVHETGEGDVNP